MGSTGARLAILDGDHCPAHGSPALAQIDEHGGMVRHPLAAPAQVADSALHMDALTPLLAGRFIVFDGPDGTGKSTQVEALASWCRDKGLDVTLVREPGGTTLGERVRSILLDPATGAIDSVTEVLLYMASRAQLLEEVVRPALAGGDTVIADRFVSATFAYQGTAGGVTIDVIRAVAEVAIGDTWPDLTILLDVDEDAAASRMGEERDRMEGKGAAYHRRVREGFLAQERQMPERCVVIDATSDSSTVFDAVLSILHERLGKPDSGQA